MCYVMLFYIMLSEDQIFTVLSKFDRSESPWFTLLRNQESRCFFTFCRLVYHSYNLKVQTLLGGVGD